MTKLDERRVVRISRLTGTQPTLRMMRSALEEKRMVAVTTECRYEAEHSRLVRVKGEL